MKKRFGYPSKIDGDSIWIAIILVFIYSIATYKAGWFRAAVFVIHFIYAGALVLLLLGLLSVFSKWEGFQERKYSIVINFFIIAFSLPVLLWSSQDNVVGITLMSVMFAFVIYFLFLLIIYLDRRG